MDNELAINPKLIPQLKKGLTIVIILVMIMNLEHCATIFLEATPEKRKLAKLFGWEYADAIFSLFVIAVIDFAIILWTKLNRYKEAGVFALVVIAINILFYESLGILEDNTNKRIAQLIFACMGGYIIRRSTYFRVKISELENQAKELPEEEQSKLNEQAEIINEQTRKLNEQAEMINAQAKKLNEQAEVINQLESTVNQVMESNKNIESHVNQLIKENAKYRENFESEFNKVKEELNAAREELIQKKAIEEELQSLKKKDESARTCEYCFEILDSTDSKRVHKGQCSKNPRNQEKKNLEIPAEKVKMKPE